MQVVRRWMSGPLLPTDKTVEALEALVVAGDRIVLEGDNQKQADFLSRSLVKVDAKKIHDLHLIISCISRPEHLTLFELGIAKKVDFAFAGPQSLRVAQLLEDGVLEIGAVHTYVELYARLLVDLIPNVVLVCAEQADREGDLFTGPNTEDTPVIVEAAAFHDAIVIVQVNEIVEKLPRVDIPGSWIDIVVQADKPFALEPLFTRDPRHINDLQILTAMMVIRGEDDIIKVGGMTAWTDLGIFRIHRLLGPTVMPETARLMLADPSGKEQSYYGSFSPHLHHGDAEILKVQHWLQKNSCRNVDLTKMAKTAGLEVRTFIRRFKTATSLKPTEYCQRLRIGKAREMLECTKQSVERISWAVGYQDPASFRRIFYKIVGLSPSEYRRRFYSRIGQQEGRTSLRTSTGDFP